MKRRSPPVAAPSSTVLIVYSTEGADFVADVYERSTRRLLLRFGGVNWPEHDTPSNVIWCARQLARATDEMAAEAVKQNGGAK